MPTALALVLVLASAQNPPASLATHTSWQLSFGGFRRIAVQGDQVVLSQTDGVYGNDLATGTSRWARQDLAQGFGVPTAGDGVVYVGAAEGADSAVTKKQATFALDARTGATLWSSPFWAYEGVADFGEHVVGIGTQASGAELAVVALRAKDGVVAWKRALPGIHKTIRRPAAAGDLALCQTSTAVVALRAKDGEIAWRIPAAERPSDVACADGVVVTATMFERAGLARGYDAATAELKWTVELSSPGGGIALTGGDVIVSTWGGEVVCITAASGKVRWKQKLADGSTTEPLVVGAHVLARRDGPKRAWIALELATGKLVGDVLEVEAKDSLVTDGVRLLWSRPAIGKLVALQLGKAE